MLSYANIYGASAVRVVPAQQAQGISIQTKVKNRLSESAVKTKLAKILTKYEHAYPFFYKNKTFMKDNYFLKQNADELIKAGMEEVALLKVTRAVFLPVFTEQIIAMQQSFTDTFSGAVKNLVEQMLNEFIAQMNAGPQAYKAAEEAVFKVQEYTAADYAQELKESNSELSADIKKVITQYVWSYAIASKKDLIVAKYVKDIVKDLIRPYTASQEDEMQTIPLVTNYINMQQKDYMELFTVAMNELVGYLKAQSKS